ncbi:amidohydrolase family protein [Subtercola frigoramans]|uniref:Cytosine deaminase n=1 Tax=Subtercola frigoramans TaxID=120298 RepID=A0ABS2L271_9MICO|nr:amidohydrolase family protein [Subtercola frigoramans]MBM7471114.1 cytosine deaminase [Subtercola frigoramans]
MSDSLLHPTVLRNARLSDETVVDLTLEDGYVRAVDPVDPRERRTSPGRPGELDLAGGLLLTAGAEPHTHLDKALVYDRLKPDYGDLASGIRQWQQHAATLDENDFVERGLAAARRFLINGVTAIRTHAEIFPSKDPLVSVRAMVRVRELVREVMDVQVVVLPKNNIRGAVIGAAIDAGADLIGGSPHNTPDPDAELARLLAVARDRGIGIDIHADERLDARSLTVRTLAEEHLRSPLRGTVTASHCVSLGLLPTPELVEIAALLRSAGVGVIAAPITNLYLQGRDVPVATPRGIAPARRLLEEGVLVAGAGDNLRDTLNPLGAADPFSTAALLVVASHLTIEQSYRAVSDSARTVMGLEAAGAEVGALADFVVVDSASLADAVSGAALGRIVLHRGRVVSRRSTNVQTGFPSGSGLRS